ncbi:DUF4085 family protein [Clostridiaceae bacterium UIB06]|uniref:DUF4085 family protein n=1 Tax=Clostridium thailandense TaxID=2794346 RepID=A0A949TX31_9CLOT|nr:DUF4085 family protein [Clostridium thailandense]MBV7272518.1 DUF4085 family protein [Clostridium thailandense]MCH5138080.1 DUF4085 family protein [Clostridiaceae bacterium UIB06]
MRYITRELYEQIQFASWIEFELSPKKNLKSYTGDNIETFLKNEIEKRIKVILELPNEVKKIYRYDNVEKDYEDYIDEKTRLLKKYLPDYIKKDICDYRLLVLNLLSKDLYEKLLKWKSEIEYTWRSACNGYNKQYKAIKQYLPSSMKRFPYYKMHEEKIISLNQPSADKLCVEYKDGDWGKAYINFEGVKVVEVEGNIEGSSWLHSEVYLSNEGEFEYQVLLDNSELRVVAKDIYISFVNNDYIKEASKLENYNDSFNEILEIIRGKAIVIGKENLLEEESKLLLIDTLICMLKHDSVMPNYKKISSGFEQFLFLNSKHVTETLAILEKIGEKHVSSMLTQAINIYNSDKEKYVKSIELKKIDKDFLSYEKTSANELYELFIDYMKKNLSKYH